MYVDDGIDDVWIRKPGHVTQAEIDGRNLIRRGSLPPPSSGANPLIYTVTFGPIDGKTGSFRFLRSTFDPYSSVYGFKLSEVDIKNKFWYPNIKRGDVVIDGGASWGPYALPAAVMGATVHCFEIHPVICEELKENVKLNKFEKRIITNQLGLAGEYSIIDYDECKNVKFIKLDDYSPVRDKLDMLKLDVEGMELDVLHGAKELLLKHKPKIQVEIHSHYNKALMRKVTSFLLDNISDKYHRQTFPMTNTVEMALFTINNTSID